ncbi:competence type IV pilus minor pilin ComGF [Massilimicrobiota timonensis]|uniref:competence type IV pilus minor pilin ComGF n=1 Tax=Massilimicrobiota timonensis TaxID=1776392 RepID=UPI0036F34A4C
MFSRLHQHHRNGFTLVKVLLSLSITLIILLSLTSLFQLIRYAYTHHTQNNEDIYIAAKQCSQYTLGCAYLEAGDTFRYMNFEEEETSLQLDQKRLVKKPGFEILLFDIDDVSFSVENDFVYIHMTRDRQNYTFLLTYANMHQEAEETDENISEIIPES